jgi:hypothetical protein
LAETKYFISKSLGVQSSSISAVTDLLSGHKTKKRIVERAVEGLRAVVSLASPRKGDRAATITEGLFGLLFFQKSLYGYFNY